MTAAAAAEWPRVIQGGMGVAVSGWRLAAAVSRLGQLGVVSGTALGVVLARRLQDGDRGGHLRRALGAFPEPAVSARILERHFRAGGRRPSVAYRAVPIPRPGASRAFQELTVAATFAEVLLAKEGHDGPVGLNLLEKVQVPTLPALYGAMLADVDWVLMGAGIPTSIPRALRALADHARVALPLDVAGARPEDRHRVGFDPARVVRRPERRLRVPRFVAIVSSHVLAGYLARDPADAPDGFVVEHHVAGGHNAPPRGPLRLDDAGAPRYGPRDEVDLGRMRELGRPFWLAGGYAHPQRLHDALSEGAAGVQVGTAFALCEESGLEEELKRRARALAASGRLRVRTDPLASPTGYPFKVAALPETIADPAVRHARTRRCDLGYLATFYRRADGTLGRRCPAEPVGDYVAKGGDAAEAAGRSCVCNGLTAAAGIAQLGADGTPEPPLVTLGDDACAVTAALAPDGRPYRAADVLRHLLGAGAV
ncbi:MAG TPA: nitronate monooxygenase [Capillimicrobium sp.]|nr:nitronate monooxygenase [Capillimicrobium sp.]